MNLLNFMHTLLVVELILSRYSLYKCYRIIEYTYDENGSGDGEIPDDNDEENEINNSSEITSSTTNVKEFDKSERSIVIDLSRLNPGLKIIRTNPNQQSLSPIPDYSSAAFKSLLCDSNTDCKHDNICNHYTKQCERCRFENEICRRTTNCCNGRKCMWGRCRNVIYDGSENAPCEGDTDCQTNMCCARFDGESVCKKYQQDGEQCDLPLGGILFSVHHKCPCQRGLYCGKKKSRKMRVCRKG